MALEQDEFERVEHTLAKRELTKEPFVIEYELGRDAEVVRVVLNSDRASDVRAVS